MRRRVVLAVAVVVLAIVAAGVGWLFGRQSVSPQEAAARAEPPEASLITIAVERKQLVSQLVVRGELEPAGRTELAVAAPADALAVVTALPVEVDTEINRGDVVIEIAERPVFAWSGQLPAFRSLRIDARGDDVVQLEDNLLAAGLIDRADDLLDRATADAIEVAYRSAGYDAPGAESGVVLPLSEFVFVPELPRVVDAVLVERGDLVSGPVVRVASSELQVVSQIAGTDRSLVDVGDDAVINVDDLELVVSAIVTDVGDRPIDGSGGAYRIAVEPVGDESTAIPAGALTRVVIPIESSEGEVLVVPVAALTAGPDGSARVEVEREDDSTVLVSVTTGLTSGGEVEVAPVVDGELREGDRVVVGT